MKSCAKQYQEHFTGMGPCTGITAGRNSYSYFPKYKSPRNVPCRECNTHGRKKMGLSTEHKGRGASEWLRKRGILWQGESVKERTLVSGGTAAFRHLIKLSNRGPSTGTEQDRRGKGRKPESPGEGCQWVVGAVPPQLQKIVQIFGRTALLKCGCEICNLSYGGQNQRWIVPVSAEMLSCPILHMVWSWCSGLLTLVTFATVAFYIEQRTWKLEKSWERWLQKFWKRRLSMKENKELQIIKN